MELLKEMLPGVREGDIKLFLPFAVMLVLLLMTCFISHTQNSRMPNSICLSLLVLGLGFGALGISYLDLLDMVIGFGVSVVAIMCFANMLRSKDIGAPAGMIKYFSVLGVYFGMYNIINIIIFSAILIGVIFLVRNEDKRVAVTPLMTFSSVLVAAFIILLQNNIIPLADSVLNLYPVFK